MAFRTASKELALDRLSDHLYSLRHGGASHDLLFRRRDLSAVKERGRWMTDASLKRYGKATLLQREINRVPAGVLDFSLLVEQHFCDLLRASVSGQGLPLQVPIVVPGQSRKKRGRPPKS